MRENLPKTQGAALARQSGNGAGTAIRHQGGVPSLAVGFRRTMVCFPDRCRRRLVSAGAQKNRGIFLVQLLRGPESSH